MDGNKRTAFAAIYTFLAINGARLTADTQETYPFGASIYEANQFSFDNTVPWLRKHARTTLRTRNLQAFGFGAVFEASAVAGVPFL